VDNRKLTANSARLFNRSKLNVIRRSAGLASQLHQKLKMKLSISAFLLFAAAFIAWASEPPAARWEGAVQIPGREIKLVIDLAQNSQGQWVGSAIVPGFGIKGIPLADIAVRDSSVSFAFKNVLSNPKFEGHLASNGTLTGEFKQAGHSAPFALQNAGPAQVELSPVSTSVSKELEGEWKGEMSFAGNQFRIGITLANQADGKATGKFVIIGKKENKLSIDLVTQDGDMLTVEMHEPGITYEGRYRKDQNEINGTFLQEGIEIPLILHAAAKI
jgi:hypothetical protein